MVYYASYISSSVYDLQHHGILGMKWGIRRYQPYPSGYTGDGKYVGDSSGDQKVAKQNVKTAIKDLNKNGSKAYQATKELDKAKMVLGAEYVNKAIKRDNIRKASVKVLKNSALVVGAVESVRAMSKILNNYYSISGLHGYKTNGFNLFGKNSPFSGGGQTQAKSPYDDRYQELMKQNQQFLNSLIRDTQEDVKKWKK